MLEDTPTYGCTMYVSLDNPSVNGIYSNGRNEIHVLVSYAIYPNDDGGDNASVPTQDSAQVTIVNYLTGAAIPPVDPDNNPGTTRGWKYWTKQNQYLNPFTPGAGSMAEQTPEHSGAIGHAELDSHTFATRDFYLYNDSGVNEGLQVAASVTWTDPAGTSHTWNTVNFSGSNAFSAVSAIRPKVYGSVNTNGPKLDPFDYAEGHLPTGSPWYQRNYFFKITDSGFQISDATIANNTEGTNFAMLQDRNDQNIRYYYYLWNLKDPSGQSYINPFEMPVEHNERLNEICLTRIRIINYNTNTAPSDDKPTVEIFDNYGNSTTFVAEFNSTGDTVTMTNNNH